MTDFEKTYQNYNPRQAALDEARALLTEAAKAAMADGTLPEAELPAFIVEIPADVKNGDIASNLAMAGARTWRKAPKMIADALIAHLPSIEGSVFSKVEVAGPGFINLFLSQSFWAGVVLGACANKEYGRTDHGKGAKYNVEFVSANPTGPMHMGNARGGALGDCLAAVLDWAGYDVTREFYINDAGNQIQKFGKSLAVRYLQQFCGEEAYPLPAECYQGGDIKVLAGEFAEIHGDAYVAPCKGMSEEELFASEAFETLKNALVDYALPKNIAALQRDLGKYRIDYDVWFHESTLHESGAVKAVVDKLLELGACYKAEDGAVMYRSAQYAAKYGTVNKKKTEDGTEEEAKDEVLVRANGIPTYFAADIAYYWDKRHRAENSADVAIYMLGADHHGYIGRMMAMCAAFGDEPGKNMQILIGQLVNVMKDGKPVRMSKRAGNVVTIDDLVSVVGVDAARYSLARSDYNQNFDIDLALLASHTNDNPVYYVQYAHARSKNVDRNAAAAGISYEGADLALLDTEADGEVLAALAQFPSVLATAADDRQPHKVARYLEELAATYHKWYNVERVVPMALTDPETRGDDEARKALEIAKNPEPARAAARLKLNDAVQQVIANGLDLLGVTAPEKM